MALIGLMLGLDPERKLKTYVGGFREHDEIVIDQPEGSGLKCPNRNCISRDNAERPYLRDKFTYITTSTPVLRCFYCETDVEKFVIGDKRHRRIYSRQPKAATPRNLVCFADEAQARAAGFSQA
jgi:hypothetical protein